jgi:hypothetical protein
MQRGIPARQPLLDERVIVSATSLSYPGLQPGGEQRRHRCILSFRDERRGHVNTVMQFPEPGVQGSEIILGGGRGRFAGPGRLLAGVNARLITEPVQLQHSLVAQAPPLLSGWPTRR